MDPNKINKFCLEKGYKKKEECKSDVYGGKYKIMSIENFLRYRSPKNFTIVNINSIDCIVLYRVDFNFTGDYDILHHLPTYENKLELYSKSADGNYSLDSTIHPYHRGHPIISFSNPSSEIDLSLPDTAWGNEPGIGINTSYDLNVLYYYALERIDKNKECILYKFYVPINDTINVCVIPTECQWTHISCDEYIHKMCDFIAHEIDLDNPELNNAEINMLDNGRKKLLMAECIKVKVVDTYTEDKDIDKFKHNFIDERILKTLIIPTDSHYEKKYLKYKQKYLNLKKNIE